MEVSVCSAYMLSESLQTTRFLRFAAPGHGDVDVPQNAAWLSGIRLAQKSVFMCVVFFVALCVLAHHMYYSQTPDFNAEPVVAAILDACRRGVECTLYVCLGG